MQLFFEIFPVFLFFIAFKFYDIYMATLVGIVSTSVQALGYRVWRNSWDKKQLITLAIFLVFGGLTLYFHNPIFVKWKPTIIFWVFSIALLISQVCTSKPLIQRLMENMLEGKGEVPRHVWHILNVFWIVFFIFLGAINLFIAYYFSNDAWVNFKFYGISSALLIISFAQAIYLMRYVKHENVKS